MKEIDARGLACPAPVLMTRDLLEKKNLTRVRVTVDNAASQENVLRFLESRGFKVEATRKGDDFFVTGTKSEDESKQIPPAGEPLSERQKIVVMCTTDRLGDGDDELGRSLMINFIRTLTEMGEDLWRLVFVNYGVKLTTEGSAVLDDLAGLESSGVKILVCGTCLKHLDLLEKKKVGETTNMLDIVTSMQLADKIINI